MDWFLIGKGVLLFNLYAEYIMWNARQDEAQADSSLPGEI